VEIKRETRVRSPLRSRVSLFMSLVYVTH
jgi:hypothetical protein